jgi:multiple sugar transport system substrate-binding protein
VQDLLRSQAIGEPLPDVAFHGLHRVRLLVERDLIAPLDELIARDPTWASAGFIPAMQRLGEMNGRQYALSFATSTMVAHYNADLIERAGGSPETLPRTWDDVLSLARRVREKVPDVQNLYWFHQESNNNYTFHSLVQGFGGRMITPEGGIAFDSPEGLQALRLLRRFGEVGMVDVTDRQAVQSFSSGTLAIYLASTARVDQLARGSRGRFRYVVGPLPTPARNASFPAGGAGVMMHARDARQQRAAWEFMKFAAGPIGQTVMVRRSGYMPGNEKALQDPELLGRFYEENPNHRVSLSQLPRMTPFQTFPGENSVKIPTVIRDHLQSVVTLRRQPEEVMPDMVRDVRALLPNQR